MHTISEVGLFLERKEFSDVFNEIWDRILTDYNQNQDENNNIDKHRMLIQRLFTNQKSFNEVYTSFSAWWKGLTAKFAIQNFLDKEKIDKLYTNLLKDFQQTNTTLMK